ncbi:Uncharacterised protein [Klebsiella pneumoniae]|nr:Uncharacterised protein [Klebsiella pneumoniae]SWS53158.1 Uncharacterised protein [Klebsiella pneumoniae]VGO99270.1 hypothetical protein SB00610_00544 [Klebsiella quasipneumoniae subsp. similipneumoniae]
MRLNNFLKSFPIFHVKKRSMLFYHLLMKSLLS